MSHLGGWVVCVDLVGCAGGLSCERWFFIYYYYDYFYIVSNTWTYFWEHLQNVTNHCRKKDIFSQKLFYWKYFTSKSNLHWKEWSSYNFFGLQTFSNLNGPSINHVLGPTCCKRAIVYTRSRIFIFHNMEGYGVRYELGK